MTKAPVLMLILLVLASTVAVAAPPDDFTWHTAETVPDASPSPPVTRALRTRGASLYRRHCAGCHGTAGRGDGAIAPSLRPPPRDFTTGVYKVRSTPSGELPTELDLYNTVSRGLHGTAMFPWTRLPSRDRWALVHHLRALSPRFAAEPPPSFVVVPRPPPRPERLVDRGETLYTTLRCGACHGAAGAGDGPAAAAYARDPGRPVSVRRLDRQRFIRGSSLEDIFLTLVTGMDGTPMGSYEALPAEDLWALAAYVHHALRRPPPPEPGGRAND